MSPAFGATGAPFEGEANAYQRASVLSDIPNLLAEFGVNPERALDGLALDLSIFTEPNRFIPYSTGTRVLANCVSATGCAHFELMLGARMTPAMVGPPGRWLAEAPDLQTALSGFQLLQGANSRGAMYYLRRAAPDFIFGYGVYDGAAIAHDQAYAAAMASAFNILRLVSDGAVRPSEVLFSFRRPEDASPYFSLFGAPVRFDQYKSGLVFAESMMRAPIAAGSKAADFDFWRKKTMEISPRSERPWTDSVRHALRLLIVEQRAFASAAAQLLKVDVRTLARHLAAEGTSFQQVADGVRYAIARELLVATDLGVGDIAMALSYATHGAFVVAFRRWSGMSPREWRSQRGKMGVSRLAGVRR